MSEELKPYPRFVCHDCGSKANKGKRRKSLTISTSHEGVCELCGYSGSVTSPKTYFYPNWEGHHLGHKPRPGETLVEAPASRAKKRISPWIKPPTKKKDHEPKSKTRESRDS